ncbi:hypothetical protein C7U61_02440 [Rhizobium sp. JAB6]|uniref:DUF2806 domain-containing protein n=1 Tax=Rhizobium sp. JAB6 TaxID=2127050 RepID=UPI000D11DA81|nr:DUF2806 domain-containing protein [Rhizobium sp. JAB6]PST23402.1 hypothetical protein C7U61_02440 [Rhizobium sp. JAB6]
MEITNLTGLEKPATELISRVSDAVGGIAKPWQIRRVAQAEADAKKILALADIEITETRERAVKRMVLEEEKNQENIESITTKAIPHLSADAKPDELDEDFVRYLFEKARLVSNEEMQSVWAKILAGEANKTGSFSRRTMDIVAQMSRSDAELFTRFCRNLWMIGNLTPMFPRESKATRDEDGYSMSFTDLAELESMGLIQHAPATGYIRPNLPKYVHVWYYGCPIALEFEGDQGNTLSIGPALLTAAGRELAVIAGSQPSKTYFEDVLQNLIDRGVRISIPTEFKNRYLALELDVA